MNAPSASAPAPLPAPRPSFRARPFASVLLLAGFLVLALSGAILFVSPPGRIANWTGWTLLGLTKHEWGDLHIVFGAAFLAGGVVHALLNLRPMLGYFRRRTWRLPGLEATTALLLALALWAGTRTHVAPISTLLAWSESLRGSWEDSNRAAPVAHAELLSLAELARQSGIAPETAVERLTARGLTGVTLDSQVRALAEQASLPPARLYELLQAGDTSHRPGSGAATTQESHRPGSAGGGAAGRGPGAGQGAGQKTLARWCADEGLELAAVEARIRALGLRADSGQTLRDIARNNGYERPFDLLTALRSQN